MNLSTIQTQMIISLWMEAHETLHRDGRDIRWSSTYVRKDCRDWLTAIGKCVFVDRLWLAAPDQLMWTCLVLVPYLFRLSRWCGSVSNADSFSLKDLLRENYAGNCSGGPRTRASMVPMNWEKWLRQFNAMLDQIDQLMAVQCRKRPIWTSSLVVQINPHFLPILGHYHLDGWIVDSHEFRHQVL